MRLFSGLFLIPVAQMSCHRTIAVQRKNPSIGIEVQSLVPTQLSQLCELMAGSTE